MYQKKGKTQTLLWQSPKPRKNKWFSSGQPNNDNSKSDHLANRVLYDGTAEVGGSRSRHIVR
ncbi:hypothetical protein SLEP1_g43813 [Rubroshorea leprosula]|uniref:Ribosomal protein L32 n=1 Tax=Rubroshorea leprosula TaxID=152421 RepID=A0AAV5LE91_9ROSI|nr:hypothetical protein SLEP1_g43813 [Rubroshorea leprosula]